jgi:hypothetical protein
MDATDALIATQVPGYAPGHADVSPGPGEWPQHPGEPGGKERRSLTADERYDALERRAWLELYAVTLEVEHYAT